MKKVLKFIAIIFTCLLAIGCICVLTSDDRPTYADAGFSTSHSSGGSHSSSHSSSSHSSSSHRSSGTSTGGDGVIVIAAMFIIFITVIIIASAVAKGKRPDGVNPDKLRMLDLFS